MFSDRDEEAFLRSMGGGHEESTQYHKPMDPEQQGHEAWYHQYVNASPPDPVEESADENRGFHVLSCPSVVHTHTPTHAHIHQSI